MRFTAALLFILLSVISVSAAEITISGTEIYSEEQLLLILGINKNSPKKISSSNLRGSIKNFYLRRGYSKVKVYVIEENRTKLTLYVDEGRIAKIVVLNLNELDTLRFKAEFRPKHKIYNKNNIIHDLNLAKKKLGFHRVTHRLVPVKEYSDSKFQIDRQNIPGASIPFLKAYPPLYDLEIDVVKNDPGADWNKNKDHEKNGKTAYAMGASGSQGLIPQIRYYQSSLFSRDDMFEAGISGGIFWGLDREFSEPPRLTFTKVDSRYSFAPLYADIFTPVIKTEITWRETGRRDLGLTAYDFWSAESVVAPGFTFFKKFKIHSGFGFEYASFNDAVYDYTADYVLNIDGRTYFYRLIDTEARLEMLPIRLGRNINKNLIAAYTAFFNSDRDFSRFKLNGVWDFEYDDDSVYTLQGSYKYLSGEVPFYHQAAVKSSSFRGLAGVYTTHSVSAGNEYRISIYREYIYAGVLGDLTYFSGNGYGVIGTRFALALGPTVRVLVLDQFEFYMYYTRDLMIPDYTSQGSISLSLYKKW